MTRGRHERLAAAFCIPATASRGTWPGWTPGFEGKALRANQRHHPDVRWLAAGDSFPARHLAMAAERNAAVASMDLLRIQLASRRATSQHPKAVRIRAVAMARAVPGRGWLGQQDRPPEPFRQGRCQGGEERGVLHFHGFWRPRAIRTGQQSLQRRDGSMGAFGEGLGLLPTPRRGRPTRARGHACRELVAVASTVPGRLGAVRVFRPGLAEGEAVGLGAWGGEGDLESAVGYGAGLAD